MPQDEDAVEKVDKEKEGVKDLGDEDGDEEDQLDDETENDEEEDQKDDDGEGIEKDILCKVFREPSEITHCEPIIQKHFVFQAMGQYKQDSYLGRQVLQAVGQHEKDHVHCCFLHVRPGVEIVAEEVVTKHAKDVDSGKDDCRVEAHEGGGEQ